MNTNITAGRDQLGDFAPAFAHLNDDVLFGEVWARQDKLDAKTRSIITVTSLMTAGLFDSSFQHHLMTAKKNGVTKTEIAEILTQLAFYSGWPKAWAAFRVAKDVWTEDEKGETLEDFAATSIFPVGQPNDAFAAYFKGNSYLAWFGKEAGVGVANVTFEPGCRNNWHNHKAEKGGGQILLCTAGRGWYQEWGKQAQSLKPGDVVFIPANVKHWHGAAKDSWFSHIAIEVPGEGASNEWLEEVSDEEYSKLN